MWHERTMGIDETLDVVNRREQCYANIFYDANTNELFADLQPCADMSGYDFYSPKVYLCIQIEPDGKYYTKGEITDFAAIAVKKTTRHPWRSFFVGNLIVFVVLMYIGLACQYLPLFLGLYAQYFFSSYIWLFVMKR